MALNFGSFFEKLLGQDLREVADKGNKTFSDFSRSISDVSDAMAKSMNDSASEVRKLTKTIEEYREQIEELDIASKDMSKTEEERIEALYRLEMVESLMTQAENERIKVTKDLQKKTKQFNKDEKDLLKKRESLSKLTFANVAKNNQQMMNDFANTGQATSALTGKILTDFREIEQETLSGKFIAGFNLATSKFKDFGPEMGSMIGDAASNVLSEAGAAFGPLGMVIGDTLGKSVGKAVAQMSELNKAIVQLTRDTGGLVTAASLGTDAMGNIAGTMTSLKTATLGANVSMEQFNTAIADLMSQGMGNIAGAASDIKKSGSDIRKYGIEAARFAKMYGADISGTVRNMFMDFGKPIGDITESIGEASMKIEAAGLSVKQFVQNLEELTAMSGEIYFKGGIDAMEQMAETATRLGTSVSSLTDGLKQMNSLTDLYTQQQKAAAMGMHNLGRNMAKVFALKQAGKGEEAATLRLSSAAQDLAQFMDQQTGTLTQQGIATAAGMGMSEEDIKNINKLSRGAKEAGVSFAKFMGPLEDLTEEEKKAVIAQRKANQTLEERWNIATGTFMQSFIDPIANLLTPVLGSLMSAFEGVMSVLSTVGKIVMTVVVNPLKLIAGVVSGIFDTVGEVWGDIGSKLSDLWTAVEPAFTAIGDALSWLGKIVGKVLMVPLKLLGTVFGWVIDAATWVVDIFKKGFGWLGTIVDKIGDGLSWLWDKVKGVFQPLIDLFDWLGDAIESVIKWFEDLFSLGGDKEEVMSDMEAATAMTGAEIDKLMQTPEVAMQSLDAAKSVETGVQAAKKEEGATTPIQPLTAGQEMRKGMAPTVNVDVKTAAFGNTNIKNLTTNNS